MAKYKIWLTVKDSYGNTKELPAGDIDVDLSQEDIEQITEELPLDKFLKKSEIDFLATDEEVSEATVNTVKYSSFKLKSNNAESTGK